MRFLVTDAEVTRLVDQRGRDRDDIRVGLQRLELHRLHVLVRDVLLVGVRAVDEVVEVEPHGQSVNVRGAFPNTANPTVFPTSGSIGRPGFRFHIPA